MRTPWIAALLMAGCAQGPADADSGALLFDPATHDNGYGPGACAGLVESQSRSPSGTDDWALGYADFRVTLACSVEGLLLRETPELYGSPDTWTPGSTQIAYTYDDRGRRRTLEYQEFADGAFRPAYDRDRLVYSGDGSLPVRREAEERMDDGSWGPSSRAAETTYAYRDGRLVEELTAVDYGGGLERVSRRLYRWDEDARGGWDYAESWVEYDVDGVWSLTWQSTRTTYAYDDERRLIASEQAWFDEGSGWERASLRLEYTWH